MAIFNHPRILPNPLDFGIRKLTVAPPIAQDFLWDRLWEPYRARYPLACWISIALIIHSLDPSPLAQLI